MLTQKLVLGRRPDLYIPGQATYAYILRYWYLVPLIEPPGLPSYHENLFPYIQLGAHSICANLEKQKHVQWT